LDSTDDRPDRRFLIAAQIHTIDVDLDARRRPTPSKDCLFARAEQTKVHQSARHSRGTIAKT
jgi:hypothetical protein